MLLPPALGSSPFLPVSVFGTGTYQTIAAFLGSGSRCFATLSSLLSASALPRGVFLPLRFGLSPASHRRLILCPCVPTVLSIRSTGISTCCPSPTPLGLGLGPDFPRADQLYPGNLRYSAWGIPTPISLLIPAFSLHGAPPLLSVWLRRPINAPLPVRGIRGPRPLHGFGGAFQPRAFSARDLSASELLRTLSMSGCF